MSGLSNNLAFHLDPLRLYRSHERLSNEGSDEGRPYPIRLDRSSKIYCVQERNFMPYLLLEEPDEVNTNLDFRSQNLV